MSVGERLAALAGVVRVPTDKLEIYLVRAFFDADECSRLIALIDTRRAPSTLFAANPDPDFRTSETCNLPHGDPLVAAVEARIAGLLGLDLAHGEYLQGQRYGEGQRFKAHLDTLRPHQPYWEQQKERGGQRTWTAMVYLNSPADGGETVFPRAELVVKPRAGTLLAWNNLDPAGVPNHATLHEARPIGRGVKYVVTKWFRERSWGPPAKPSC